MSDKNRGLYEKYRVERTDGKPVGPAFVLERNDPLARPALLAYAKAAREAGYGPLADDLERMAEPTVPVGTTGTATVRGVEGVRVMWCRSYEEETPFWWSTQFVGSNRIHDAEYVTGFIPDEILTDERAEQIRAEERERIAGAFEQRAWIQALGHDIARYIRDGAK